MIPVYSPAALLEWARQSAPDLAITRERRGCVVAHFTFRGEPHQIEAVDRDELAPMVVAALRTAMGVPPLGTPDRQNDLEQRIVLASLAGDVASCDSLTRALVTGRTAGPLGRETAFGKAVVE